MLRILTCPGKMIQGFIAIIERIIDRKAMRIHMIGRTEIVYNRVFNCILQGMGYLL